MTNLRQHFRSKPAAKKAQVRRHQGCDFGDLATLTWSIVGSRQRRALYNRSQSTTSAPGTPPNSTSSHGGANQRSGHRLFCRTALVSLEVIEGPAHHRSTPGRELPGSVSLNESFRKLWMERGRAIVGSFGLPFEVEVANDPFFGRTGKLLATSQREESLKFELLVPITSTEHPTACVSFNYHRDLFGRAWSIETASSETAHTACVGFGVERITLALFKHHGFALKDWPRSVRDVLGL